MIRQGIIETSSNSMTKIRIERILLAIGLMFLAVWVAARLYRAIGSRVAIAQFRAEESPNAATSPSGASTASVNFRLWSTKRISAYKASLATKRDAPLAILRIPKIDVEVPIFNDTDDLTLDRGVGRIVGTAQIGKPGNLGIAGHRDGFFRGLQDLVSGDVIEVARHGQTDRYVVSEIRIVAPEDTYVLNPTQEPTLTLVTCFPFYFVGHAPKRYIVTAPLKSTSQSDLRMDDATVFTGNNTKNKEKK